MQNRPFRAPGKWNRDLKMNRSDHRAIRMEKAIASFQTSMSKCTSHALPRHFRECSVFVGEATNAGLMRRS